MGQVQSAPTTVWWLAIATCKQPLGQLPLWCCLNQTGLQWSELIERVCRMLGHTEFVGDGLNHCWWLVGSVGSNRQEVLLEPDRAPVA
jgi:hypothetical protein